MPMPSEKSDQVENTINAFAQMAGFPRDRHTAILTDQCVSCDREAKEFTDDLSRKEYTISGFCQVCQDSVFGPP
jgi:hypothetical protein